MGDEEPSAVARQGARAIRDVYIALIAEGFSKEDALQIIGVMMANGKPDDHG